MSESTEKSTARGRSNSRVGIVASNKMDKSVVVRVERIEPHPMYKRYVRRSSKFMAHDETNQCKIGDTVEIVESRPVSKRTRWRVKRVVRSSIGSE